MSNWVASPDWTYRYCISFRLTHPSLLQDEMTRRMGVEPGGGWNRGDPRVSGGGDSLPGLHHNSYWWLAIDPHAEQELTEALGWCARVYGTRVESWPQFFESGGEANLFVSLSVAQHAPLVLAPELMEELARYRIELQLDVYATDEEGLIAPARPLDRLP